jgi:hypothetical protein
MAIQSLLELMNESGVDWAGSFLGGASDFAEWDMNKMLDV